MPYKLRASDGRLMWDIKDYSIKGDTIELITTMPDKSLDLWETEFLIVLKDEKQHLLKSYEDDGNYAKVESKDYSEVLKFSGDTPAPKKRKSKKGD